MPLRLDARRLRELVEDIEANGGDASALRHELEALGPEPGSRAAPYRGMRLEEEELTTEERLNNRAGDLFLDGIPYHEIIEYDRRFSQKELVEQCRRAGLSIGRDKKEMAAKLLAHNLASQDIEKESDAVNIRIVRDETDYVEEGESHPALPKGLRYPILYKERMAVIDNIGHITYIYFPPVKIGHVEVIEVEPAYRKRGFGSKLMQFALDDMRKQGMIKVSASVLSREGMQLLRVYGFSFVDDLMEKRL